MADYALTYGVATKISQDDPSEEGYVNVDMGEASAISAPVVQTDTLLVQRGAAACTTATVAGLEAALNWLNMGYLY